jgi:hypothetical protein
MIGPDGRPRVRLIVSLRTTDLATARQRRHAAFEAQMERTGLEARCGRSCHCRRPGMGGYDRQPWHGPRLGRCRCRCRSCIRNRMAGNARPACQGRGRARLLSQQPPEPGQTAAQAALSVAEWLVDEEAQTIADKHGDAAAERFTRAARSLATPSPHFDTAGWTLPTTDWPPSLTTRPDDLRALASLLIQRVEHVGHRPCERPAPTMAMPNREKFGAPASTTVARQ